MINISNIKKTFYSQLGEEKSVFNGLNLEINQGDFISVIGSNGAGKTTLLNSISGNIELDDGCIELDGQDISTMAKHKRGEYISKVYQNPAMGTAPSMTIFENLSMADNKGKTFGLSLGLNRSRKEYYKALLKELDLGLENHLITHNLQDAIRYGNRLIMLHNGEIILDIKGKEKEELTQDALMEIFQKKATYSDVM